jgi:hypothetical protein
MTRTIQRSGSDADQFLSKLGKYIPAEMTALFITASAIIEKAQLSDWFYWGFFIFILIFSPIYFLAVALQENKPPDKAQIFLSIPAIFFWVLAIGGPFKSLLTVDGNYNDAYGILLLATFTSIVPILDIIITKYNNKIKNALGIKSKQPNSEMLEPAD